ACDREEGSGHARKPGWWRTSIALKEKSKTIRVRVEFDERRERCNLLDRAATRDQCRRKLADGRANVAERDGLQRLRWSFAGPEFQARRAAGSKIQHPSGRISEIELVQLHGAGRFLVWTTQPDQDRPAWRNDSMLASSFSMSWRDPLPDLPRKGDGGS